VWRLAVRLDYNFLKVATYVFSLIFLALLLEIILRAMPRSAINLEPYKAEIVALYTKNIPCDSIIENLSRTHNITISERTLRARLRGWGIQKQNRTVGTNQVLHARIKVLFYHIGLEERELLEVLQQDGFDITARTLLYLRHKLGLYRRIKNPIVDQKQVENVLEQLRAELNHSKVEGFGETLLHTFYQSKGHLLAR
jgi:hypothetical protein